MQKIHEISSREMACIIVTYNPEKHLLLALFSQLLKSSVSIYVIDNFFSAHASQVVREICSQYEARSHLISLEKNYGIAKAINIGVDAAFRDHHNYVMLLDQDSIPQDGLLEEMLTTAKNLMNTDTEVVAIGPRLYDPRSKVFFKFSLFQWGFWKKVGCPLGRGDLIPCEFINSSGSLIFLNQWERVGPFREDFFIDHVETEWYMRVRYLGLKCYGYCSRSYLEHHMGDAVCRFWFGRWRYMPRRSPARHYTIVRNGIWMWKFKHTPMAWIVNSLLKVGFTLLYFSLFDKERGKQFTYILKGIRDGLTGKQSV